MYIICAKCFIKAFGHGCECFILLLTYEHPYQKCILLHKKAVSHSINSHVLTGKNPSINQAIHVLLMHGFYTLHMRILGRHKNDVINSNVHRNERNLVTVG